MGSLRFAFSVLILCVLEGWSSADDHASISRLLETVLKIEPPVDLGINKSRVRAPDHMMDFYHQLTNSQSSDHLNDNIIRNIFPLQDNWGIENSELLSKLMIFNLSCVQPGEAVYSAQLNLDPHDFIIHPHHKDPQPHKRIRRRKIPPLQLRVFRLSTGLKPVELGLIPLPPLPSPTSRQITSDLTAFLLDTIASSDSDILIAVRLEAPNNLALTPKMAVHSPNTTHRAGSFLVVFSEENIFRPFPQSGLRTGLLAMLNSSADAENEIPRSTGKAGSAGEESSGFNSESNDVRVRRSLNDNELTDDESEEERKGYYVFPHNAKGLMKRKTPKKGKAKPHLNDHIIGRRYQDCRRKRLTVNFADIGWGEWVLSPQAFEAYYCDGSCSYPLIRSMKPTNHATLQSMVRAVGGQDIPEPRCVADSLSPVTLLYIDQVGNIVLKNYPAMSVRSCACR